MTYQCHHDCTVLNTWADEWGSARVWPGICCLCCFCLSGCKVWSHVRAPHRCCRRGHAPPWLAGRRNAACSGSTHTPSQLWWSGTRRTCQQREPEGARLQQNRPQQEHRAYSVTVNKYWEQLLFTELINTTQRTIKYAALITIQRSVYLKFISTWLFVINNYRETDH